jgi:hypothetical protein
MMFMHISPEANMVSESVSTLKFASRVSEITLGQVSGGGADPGAAAVCGCCPGSI